MENIKKNGRKGAAMIIALLVFFLAALSGTVVLTMASSNAGRYTHTKEDQQSYLAVMSAVQMIKNEFESGVSASIEFVYENNSLRKESEVSVSASGIFGKMMNGDMKTALECIAGNRSELTNYNNGSYIPPEVSELQKINYILQINDSSLRATLGDIVVGVSLNSTTAYLEFDFYYTGNGTDSYHVKMQIGNGSGQVVSVGYPTPTGSEVRIKIQFDWSSVGATIQTVS